VKAYYDARAPEYDEWYKGLGRFDQRVRPEWDLDVRELEEALARLPPLRTLDVACGTGFLTRHLHGAVVALDQSPRMLAVAREQAPRAELVQGDALDLPFPDSSFDRVFTGHFYGHLEAGDRERFLEEARRVAPELVVVDSITRVDEEPEQVQERILNDGTHWTVYKRYFEPEQLVEELGGGEVVLANRWFVVVRA
jgi:demethylmenaquinone methyltransferase/2-methoxy-6-polyprenyl-1,4-benzoquinol methylase